MTLYSFQKNLTKTFFITILFCLSLSKCAKKDKSESSSDGASSSSTTDDASVEDGTSIASAYPTSLALSAFSQDIATSLHLSEEQKEKTVKGKITEAKERLAGTADKCLDMNVFKGRAEKNFTCYEFDSDMNPAEFAENTSQKYGTTDGTVGGSIDGSDSDNKEACMVAFARAQVDETVEQIDQALALVSGMLCQAKKEDSDKGLPAAGKTLDLAAELKKATTGGDSENSIEITSATITQIEGSDDRKYYRSDIVITTPDKETMEVHLVHSPGEEDTGRGVLFTKRSGGQTGASPDGQPDSNNSANKNFVMSIQYDRTIEDDKSNRMRFEVRRAAIVNTVDPFTEDGLVNYAGVADEATNSEIHAINYVAFDMDVDTNEGNLSYWQNPGGNINEAARGFLFKIEKDDDGALKGCGVSGAAQQMSIRKALINEKDPTKLTPDTYWHPRGDKNIAAACNSSVYPCSGGDKPNSGSTITKQCFKQGTDGVYAIHGVEATHGYDVIETSANTVKPPTPPKERAQGKFIKEE